MDERCVNKGGRGCGGGRSAAGWVVLVAWFVGCLVGLLVWPRCCLVGWSVGWHSVDGCMEGAAPPPQCKPSLPRMGFLVSTALGENTELCGLVAWFVGCLVGLLAWPHCCLVGWSVGWHSVDGWMDGSCAASRSGGVRVSFRRFPSFRTVSAQFPDGCNKKLLR